MRPIRVVIVDDSRTMRAVIKARLKTDPEIEIVGEAGDPYEAREVIKSVNPDVITLDVEMPRMNGLEFLEKIMRLRPMPVVMISTLTQKGADASIEALALGAVDVIGKPAGSEFATAFGDLPEKIRIAARSRVADRATRAAAAPAAPDAFTPGDRVVFIGASTGGVEALLTVLSGFPANCPPTLITQHMPASFTRSFANRLNQHCAATVAEARHGDVLSPGRVFLAPGGDRHLELSRDGKTCLLREGELVSGHRPSVDVLFRSAVPLGQRAVAAILTGMGRDGADGIAQIRDAGGVTIGQDEQTCVVYGMPRVAFENGGVARQAPIEAIGGLLLEASKRKARAA